MQRRDFLGWLAVLPFVRRLRVPPSEPCKACEREAEVLAFYGDGIISFWNAQPHTCGNQFVRVDDNGRVTHIVSSLGDTRGLWGNGASSE